eukprot:g1384.t1
MITTIQSRGRGPVWSIGVLDSENVLLSSQDRIEIWRIEGTFHHELRLASDMNAGNVTVFALALAGDPYSDAVVVGSESGNVTIFDRTSGKIRQSLAHGSVGPFLLKRRAGWYDSHVGYEDVAPH